MGLFGRTGREGRRGRRGRGRLVGVSPVDHLSLRPPPPGVCVCVCVCERERERERGWEGRREGELENGAKGNSYKDV